RPGGGVQRCVAGSSGSGVAPSSAPSMIATSLTDLAIGPAVSWSAVLGMTPYRLMRPTVGLMPASMFWFDGLSTDPDVSVPTLPPQKFAAVPTPELEPPVFSAARPSKVASRGSFRGSYGL